MPPARRWTEEADQAIRQMRGNGQTWSAIGLCLGLSRNTVIERGRRLCALAPKRILMAPVARIVSDDPNRGALPAGHPLTWGLLSDQPFPTPDGQRGDFFEGESSVVRPLMRREAVDAAVQRVRQDDAGNYRLRPGVLLF